MAIDHDRNFRSVYYDKVSFKGIEEKKFIDIIIKEEPIDQIKLSQFCLKFPIPSAYRYFIWQVLLGVLPDHHSAHAPALEQRKYQYDELENALRIMRKIDAKTPRTILFLKMYLIEAKILPFDDDDTKLVDDNVAFFQVAEILAELVNDNVQAFWTAVKFVDLLEKNAMPNRQVIQSELEQILSREDSELCEIVRRQMLLDIVPLQMFFSSAFASLLPEDILERVWDRVIGGSFAYLSYVFVAILLVLKRQIIVLSTVSINQVLANISADQSELIVSMANELWSRDGCPLLFGRDSCNH